ncbi:efflux RND transporter periplasmic adaptor subunit [Gaopeijia maritima]|uniref:efflux RND transporter periplasmic adaptor subunit n=1 Tax=Gaopeijia maritima TaxID=3119007 RepID=UPI00328E5D8E
MTKIKLWAPIALAALTVLMWGIVSRTEGASTTYRFATIGREDIESVVTATGTLEATETVDVGTQVSGQIAELLVDYNDHVTAGQLLARIDPTILEQEVGSAEANLARSQAELDQAERELTRSEELHDKRVVTDAEHDQALYAHAVATASHASAQIALERARRNLEYSEVRAPNDGVVVSRDIDVGQTVAASLSAPTLFVIAQDLSEMEILASVDESDIGLIHDGQDVRFSVRAYADEEFSGTVRQVRLQSTTQENVVNYSVVIGVDNEDGRLLPGMTATVEFVIDRAVGELTVPNTALRFQATEAMQEQVLANRPVEGRDDRGPADGEVPAGADASERPVAGRGASGVAGDPTPDGSAAESEAAVLWYLDANGELAIAPIRTGLSDGRNTVIVAAPPEVAEGLQVIAAVVSGDSSPAAATNPFQSGNSAQSAPPGPRGAF